MEVFSQNIVLKDWGVVYLGIRKQWLTCQEVISYCEKGNIFCTEKRMVELYLSYEDSLYSFLKVIKKFIEEDCRPPILCNEDSNEINNSCIPQEYWCFWEAEFLLRIINSKKDKESKLYEVAAIYEDFNYPQRWHNFLYYMPAEKGKPTGIDTLYKNLQKYLEELLRNI